ncbi:hypothetical protein HN832_02730 [archaeon]|jgi:hypothetical protein|nr:hypothetical protein [archaeon]MBT4373270.1 hypothetical protein [archaeon]MBT4531615.1 hypothetical protein [archaeon]MBT7001207.1 hypothetical protein [archaeon]MBT7282307.1 hypothetical protein [archaeon]
MSETDKECRDFLAEVVQNEKGRQSDGTYRKEEHKELSRVLVALVEDSDYGRKPASIDFFVPHNRPVYGMEAIDASMIDGLLMQGMQKGNMLLGRFGSVGFEPYSKGLGTKSAHYAFTPRKQE